MMEVPYHYQFRLIVIGDTMAGKSSLLKTFAEGNFEDMEPTVGVDFFSKIIEIRPKSSNNQSNYKNIYSNRSFQIGSYTNDDSIVVKLQIWDTAGQERFKSIVTSYYRNSVGIILVYDITNKESYNHLKDWFKEAKQYVEPDSPFYPSSSEQSLSSNFPVTSTPNQTNNSIISNNANNNSELDNISISNSCSNFQGSTNNASRVSYLVIGCKTDLESQRQVSYEDGRDFADMYGFKFIETSSKTNYNVNKAFEMLAEEIYDKISESGQQNRLYRTPSGVHLTFDRLSSKLTEGIRVGPLLEAESRRINDNRIQLLEAQPVSGFLGGCC